MLASCVLIPGIELISPFSSSYNSTRHTIQKRKRERERERERDPLGGYVLWKEGRERERDRPRNKERDPEREQERRGEKRRGKSKVGRKCNLLLCLILFSL